MSLSQSNIEHQALKLPREDRARMALHLLDSLEKNHPSTSSKDAIENAWIDESLKRLEAYQRGEMQAFSIEDIIADLERSTE